MKTFSIILLLCSIASAGTLAESALTDSRKWFAETEKVWQPPDQALLVSEIDRGVGVAVIDAIGKERLVIGYKYEGSIVILDTGYRGFRYGFGKIQRMATEFLADKHDPNDPITALSLVHRVSILQQWWLLCYVYEITLDIRGPADEPNEVGELLWTYTKQIRPFDPVDLTLGCFGYMIDAPLPECIPPGSTIHFSGISRRVGMPEIAQALEVRQ